LHVGAREQRAALGCTDRKACEVIVVLGVEPRHLRRLAADQRAACKSAAIGNTLDDVDAGLRRELAGGEIVEKKQRLRALYDDVVDTHRDQIDADGGVLAGLDGDLHLGADAVIGGNKDRIGKACRFQIEQTAKAPDLRVRAWPTGSTNQGLDGFDHGIASIDIDASFGIGQSIAGIL
jgi:hypothetical protein